MIANSFKRKAGDCWAQEKVAPRATASSALRVVERAFPSKNSLIRSRMEATRDEPPTNSMEWTSSLVRSASLKASSKGFATRANTSGMRPSICSRVSLDEASTSFMIDSTESGDSALAERIFFSLSHCAASRKVALGFESTSILYLVLNSAAKWRTSA